MYQSYYNLSGKPFRLSPDPGFFFPSRGHKRALAYLRYGLSQNEGFVVITGAPGTGKTTLAQILLEEMGEKNIVVAHLTTTQLEADDMLRMVAASFGLRYENLDKAALLKSLETYLLARSREGKRALLVIDESQNLPARSLEELRMLSNLQMGDRALVQTFLLGQEQFRNMLDHPDLEQLRQRVIANYHLSPLAQDESQRYIESRLAMVDWRNDPQFAEMAFELIHQYTEGVPRRINMLCDRIMLFSCMEEIHEITGEVVNLVTQELEQEVSGNPITVSQITARPKIYSSTNSNIMEQPEQFRKNAGKDKAKTEKVELPETGLYEEPDLTSPPGIIRGNVDKVETKSTANSHTSKAGAAKPGAGQGEDFSIDFNNAKMLSDDEFTDIIDFANLDNTDKSARDTKPARKKSARVEVEEKKDSSNDRQKDKKTANTEVQGNVAKQKELDSNEQGLGSSSSGQYSERDLFRVIPGGKNGNTDSKVARIAASTGSEDVVLRRILRLVLAFHRSPSSFPGLDDHTQPLPEGISQLLELSISDDQVLSKVSPASVMGISPVMLRAAVRFFVRRTFFVNEEDNYRVLGLAKDASLQQIEQHYDLLMRLLRQDKQPGVTECVDQVGKAYEALARINNTPVTVKAPRFDDQAKDGAARESSSQNKAESTGKDTALGAERTMRMPSGAKPVVTVETNAKAKTSVKAKSDDGSLGQLFQEQDDLDNAMDENELTIDFSQELEPPKPRTSLANMIKNSFDRDSGIAGSDPRVTRKRVHLLGQAAVLGIGALVVVLALVITQLEPSDPVQEPMAEAPESADDSQQMAALDAKINALSSELNTVEQSSEQTDSRINPEQFTIDDAEAAKPVAKAAPKVREPVRTETIREPVRETVRETKRPVTVASKPSEVKVGEFKGGNAAADATKKLILQTAGVSQSAKKEIPVSGFKPASGTGKTAESKVTVTEFKPGTGVDSVLKTVPVIPKGSTGVTASSTQLETKPGSRFQEVPVIAKASGDTGTSSEQVEKVVPVTPKSTVTATVGLATVKPLSMNKSSVESPAPVVAANNRFPGKELLDVPAKPKADALTIRSAKPANVATPKADPTIVAAVSSELTQPKAEAILNKFVNYYTSGDLDKMMSLFASNAKSNDQSGAAGIRKDYRELFGTTKARSIKVSNVFWQVDNSQARGLGQYTATITSARGTQEVSGKLTIQLEKLKAGNKITRLFFTSDKVTAGKAPAVVAKLPVEKLAAGTGAPSKTEIKQLLTLFTRSYEDGDINGFMSLFTEDARTNDQTNVAGIKQDHIQLFKTTSERQLFIKGMQWKKKGVEADGSGQFEVLIRPLNSAAFNSVSGTIRLVVRRGKDGKVRIRQMFHFAK